MNECSCPTDQITPYLPTIVIGTLYIIEQVIPLIPRRYTDGNSTTQILARLAIGIVRRLGSTSAQRPT